MADERHGDYPPSHWDACPKHEWEEVESQFSNEFRTTVECKICKCPGDMRRDTGDVFWPTT